MNVIIVRYVAFEEISVWSMPEKIIEEQTMFQVSQHPILL